MESAHARSFSVSGPPVCCSASCNISFQPAASESAIPTACFTNAETFGDLPALTNSPIWVTCSVGSVMVILVVAISKTISRFRLNETQRIGKLVPVGIALWHSTGPDTHTRLPRASLKLLIRMKVLELIRLVENDGWKYVKTTGSHRRYKHEKGQGVSSYPAIQAATFIQTR